MSTLVDEKEAVRIRKTIIMSLLTDGKQRSIEDVLRMAQKAYEWIITGAK